MDTQNIDWTQAACRDYTEVFADPALEYSPNSPEFANLTPQDHAEKAVARREAEDAAIDVCMGCPLMLACEQYALQNAVYGVAGGRTAAERHAISASSYVSTTETSDNVRERSLRNRVNDEAVAVYTRQGWTNQRIAEHLECTTRTVARSRARMRKIEEQAAESAVTEAVVETTVAPAIEAPAPAAAVVVDITPPAHNRSRISPAMQVIHQILADGLWHDREDLLAEGVSFVPDEEALRWYARRNPEDNTSSRVERISRGARSIVDNALSASARTRSRNEYDRTLKRYRVKDTSAAQAVRTAA